MKGGGSARVDEMAGEDFDVIVIGCGLFGAATAAALANDGRSVLVLEARGIGHNEGSSHGRSRIIRTLRAESSVFGDMARESFDRMMRFNTARRRVVRKIEAVFIASASSQAFRRLTIDPGTRTLTAAEVLSRWGMKLEDSEVGVLDGTSGIFDPTALLEILREAIGIDKMRWETEVTSWQANRSHVSVSTITGERFTASKLVIAAGAWLPALLECGTVDGAVKASLSRMKLERIPLFYFDHPEGREPVIPITVFDDAEPDMYAMPEFDQPGSGPSSDSDQPRYLKVGFHKGTEAVRPGDVCRTVQHLEERYAKEYMQQRLGLDLRLRRTAVCLYALPPDIRRPGQTEYNELPLLGVLPGSPGVFLAAYGGGICAKYALILGEELSRVLQGNQSKYALGEFDPAERLMLE
jgi:sarcosine oxidase